MSYFAAALSCEQRPFSFYSDPAFFNIVVLRDPAKLRESQATNSIGIGGKG